MAVSDIFATNTLPADYVSGSDRVTKKTLGQEDFFKLLSTQMASQDPLKPMEDTAFVSQMASFSSLEMMGNVSNGVNALAVQQSYLNASTLLDRVVTARDDTGNEVTGIATGITTGKDGTTKVVIDGEEFSIANISRVRLKDAASTPTTSTEG